jgi:hypothetical protein
MESKTMTFTRDISSAFAEIGRCATDNPFFTATAITVFLWIVVWAAHNTCLTLIAVTWTLAYLLECVIAVSVTRPPSNKSNRMID